MKHTFSLFFIALLVATLTARAQDAPVPLSLEDCMNYAMKHNYSVKNAKLDVLIQQAQNMQTTSAALPHISGKAELDDFIDPTKSFIDISSFAGGGPRKVEPVAFTLPFATSLGLSASQVIFDGSVMVALKARNAAMDLARLNGEVNEVTVRYNVYKAYNALVIAYRQFDIIKGNLQNARKIEHDIIVTQENGLAEKIDVERTNVQVTNLATDSIRVNNMLSISEAVLKYQIGMDIKTHIILTDTVIENRKLAISDLLEENENYSKVPEYNALQALLKLNKYNVERFKYSALPSLSAFASTGYNYGDYYFSNLFTPVKYASNTTIGLQLNVPIFNGLMRVNQLKEARLNVEKTENNIENMKLTIDFQTEQYRTALRNARLEVRNQHRNMDIANDVLDLAQKKYKAGVGSNTEVTQAQTDLLNAQNNYFSALLDVINAEADLKKALGLLK